MPICRSRHLLHANRDRSNRWVKSPAKITGTHPHVYLLSYYRAGNTGAFEITGVALRRVSKSLITLFLQYFARFDEIYRFPRLEHQKDVSVSR